MTDERGFFILSISYSRQMIKNVWL